MDNSENSILRTFIPPSFLNLQGDNADMRLFIAILFPAPFQKTLLDVAGQLRAQSHSGNFSRPENLHLTLACLGETDKASAARKAIAVSAGKPFDLALNHAGHFGDLWWVGLEKSPALLQQVQALHTALRAEGFVLEDRKFQPHITLARRVAAKQPIHLDVPPAHMLAERISLMKSERIRGVLTYSEIYARPLQ